MPHSVDTRKIIVRNATVDDADFLGELMVDSFRSKFEFVVGIDKIDSVKKITANLHRNVKPEHRDLFFSRQFIAEVEGCPAGVLQLVTAGDSKIDMDMNFSDFQKEIGLLKACRLMYFFWLCEEDVQADATYVDHVCVREDFRGLGIGQLLMEKAELEARKLNSRTIYLMVAADNRARSLYERHGYVVTDTINGLSGGIAWIAMGKSSFYRMEKTLS